MFGTNPIMKQELTDGRSLRVVAGSPFYTIQGEGPFMGHPAVFVRLHGCNLRCWFCDTEFSNPTDPDIPVVRLARLVWDTIALDRRNCRLVVITGGEPMRQNIVPFCEMLISHGMTVQIETAGTLWPDGLEELCNIKHSGRLQIVCSPKTGKVHEMVKMYAVAYKYVIDRDTSFVDGWLAASTQDEHGKLKQLAKPRTGCPVYLSPCDEQDVDINRQNRRRVARLALEHGFIAGVQMHKLLEIDEP